MGDNTADHAGPLLRGTDQTVLWQYNTGKAKRFAVAPRSSHDHMIETATAGAGRLELGSLDLIICSSFFFEIHTYEKLVLN